MKKKACIIIPLLVCLLLSACAGKEAALEEDPGKGELEEAEAVQEETAADPAQMAVNTETMTESYGVLKRAGAGESLFLEEDITALVEEAKNNPPLQVVTESPAEAAESPIEVSENTSGEDAQEEEETEEDVVEGDGEEENAETGESAAQPATGGGRVVCIDAGHQRKQNSAQEPIGPGATTTKMKVTSGTSGTTTGVPEYQLTLAVALKLQNVLQQRGYTVVMCRSSHDVDISNSERAQIANNAGAAAFIRIHADGSNNASAAGGCTLAPSASNPYCGAIASSSQALAKNLINSYCAKTGIKNRGMQINDNMSGLNWSQVPVAIIEMGFMTNPSEDQLMQTESFQQAAAEGMADGIDAFMAGR